MTSAQLRVAATPRETYPLPVAAVRSAEDRGMEREIARGAEIAKRAARPNVITKPIAAEHEAFRESIEALRRAQNAWRDAGPEYLWQAFTVEREAADALQAALDEAARARIAAGAPPVAPFRGSGLSRAEDYRRVPALERVLAVESLCTALARDAAPPAALVAAGRTFRRAYLAQIDLTDAFRAAEAARLAAFREMRTRRDALAAAARRHPPLFDQLFGGPLARAARGLAALLFLLADAIRRRLDSEWSATKIHPSPRVRRALLATALTATVGATALAGGTALYLHHRAGHRSGRGARFLRP